MSCAPFKTKQLFFSFQFYIMFVQNQNFDFGSGGIHILVSTNRESEWKLVKFCYRHHQCHHIGCFNPYHIVYTLCFTGYYVLCRRQCSFLWFSCFSRWEGQFLNFIGCQLLDNQFRSSDQIDQHLGFLWWGSCPHLHY